MTQIYWILFVTMTTVSIQATGDIASLEKKMHLLEQQVNMRLKSHDARLEQLESKPSLCSKYMADCLTIMVVKVPQNSF